MPAPSVSRLPDAGCQLSLHIRHPTLDPAEITRELRREPVECFAIGEPCQSSAGAGLAPRLHTESYWAATLDLQSLARDQLSTGYVGERAARAASTSTEIARRLVNIPEASLALACSSLMRHADFFRRLSAGGGSAKLVIALSESALRLAPEMSRRLADLGITLEAEFLGR